MSSPLLEPRVAVVGATTWGTALAIILARKGLPVSLLARTDPEAQRLQADRRNARFLPSTPFPESLTVAADPGEALPSADLVIIAAPSHSVRDNIRSVRESLTPGVVIVSAGQRFGIARWQADEPGYGGDGICAMSGPNFADEIVQGKFASTVVAGRDSQLVNRAQEILMTGAFRVYTSDDLTGVELGGALKNIIALGAGIADGLEMGDNGKAAFITRGLAEIARLGVAAGAQALTFAGLAGLGDVIATCASRLSRNRYVGEQLTMGRSWPEIREAMNNVAEGVNTTDAALAMARELGVEMPITEATYRVLFEDLSPHDAVNQLMERPPRSEW
ncbi:Glycerol-3-phosphate dehydrogenase [NAD(P)+] [Geodia barretti]|uniref:Glycerol-3-phosphate dehydrogenase [NAD(+)] n=2 Tax=Geodia barretti TaxID=519541 RepID=A0AA35SP42_GEOBA|nr:Glycerol-3-phosphate dehydrogenase [NAD(P)+] [Geodia barretti]